MTTPSPNPTIALLAPVPAEVLQGLLEEGGVFEASDLIRGEGVYHALVISEPGALHDERDIEVARELSARCSDPVFVASFGEDDERITTCQGGLVLTDVGPDAGPDPEKLARKLGLGGMFPPELPEPVGFMFVEGANVTDVTGALRVAPDQVGKALHLEPTRGGVVGWAETPLESRPRTASRRLGARVYYSLETAESFAVIVIEKGETVGVFEEPRTAFSTDMPLADSILGETTREGILRAMGVDEARIEQAGAPASPT